MNERIKQLIDSLEPDAFMTYKGYLYHSGDPKVLEHSDPEPLYTRQELLKLTESIVRECTNFLKDTLDDHFAAEQLEEYFGVEE